MYYFDCIIHLQNNVWTLHIAKDPKPNYVATFVSNLFRLWYSRCRYLKSSICSPPSQITNSLLFQFKGSFCTAGYDDWKPLEKFLQDPAQTIFLWQETEDEIQEQSPEKKNSLIQAPTGDLIEYSIQSVFIEKSYDKRNKNLNWPKFIKRLLQSTNITRSN